MLYTSGVFNLQLSLTSRRKLEMFLNRRLTVMMCLDSTLQSDGVWIMIMGWGSPHGRVESPVNLAQKYGVLVEGWWGEPGFR
jgi:hypothetical protein